MSKMQQYRNGAKILDIQVWENGEDQDQTAPEGAI